MKLRLMLNVLTFIVVRVEDLTAAVMKSLVFWDNPAI
jgi:hypothetical protein